MTLKLTLLNEPIFKLIQIYPAVLVRRFISISSISQVNAIQSVRKAEFACANHYLHFLGIFIVYILISNLIISMLYFSKIYQNMNKYLLNRWRKRTQEYSGWTWDITLFWLFSDTSWQIFFKLHNWNYPYLILNFLKFKHIQVTLSEKFPHFGENSNKGGTSV